MTFEPEPVGVVERPSAPSPPSQVVLRPLDLDPATITRALEQQGTTYNGERYSGLIAPASTTLPAGAPAELRRQMAAVWEWNRVWHDLYGEHLAAGEEGHWLARATEWGTSPKALSIQRRPEVLAREPHIGRVDSVTVDPVQRIAEVQWKGGGEGFAAGLEATYQRLRPLERDERPLGEGLIDAWAAFLRRHAHGDTAFVVNSSRPRWAPSEQFLIDALHERGVEMAFIARTEVGGVLDVRNGRVRAPFPSGREAVDFLYLDRLSEALPRDLFQDVVAAYLGGALHLDPPPTYLYNQKFGFVLPFHPEYRDRFSDDVRSVLIPAVLVGDAPPDLAPIAADVEHPKRDLLAEVRTWEDLQLLPVSLRRQLVAKCASVNGRLNNAGRGVWKLGARSTLDAVLDRVRKRGEPWLLQPYVNRLWEVPLGAPDDEGRAHLHDAHARFCVYGTSDGGRQDVLGGLATFSTFWKAAGKDGSMSAAGKLEGSAFTDIRVRDPR